MTIHEYIRQRKQYNRNSIKMPCKNMFMSAYIQYLLISLSNLWNRGPKESTQKIKACTLAKHNGYVMYAFRTEVVMLK